MAKPPFPDNTLFNATCDSLTVRDPRHPGNAVVLAFDAEGFATLTLTAAGVADRTITLDQLMAHLDGTAFSADVEHFPPAPDIPGPDN